MLKIINSGGYFSTFISEIVSFLKYQKQRVKKTPRYLLTQRVKVYLQQEHADLEEEERMTFLRFLRHHLIDIFNYPYMSDYLHRVVKVIMDKKTGVHYVITDGKRRLYFKRGLSKKDVAYMYNRLCAEQAPLSPHNYDFDPLSITSDTVIADIGSAEGNFSLKYINKIKKL
jgi:hypothetical protein